MDPDVQGKSQTIETTAEITSAGPVSGRQTGSGTSGNLKAHHKKGKKIEINL